MNTPTDKIRNHKETRPMKPAVRRSPLTSGSSYSYSGTSWTGFRFR